MKTHFRHRHHPDDNNPDDDRWWVKCGLNDFGVLGLPPPNCLKEKRKKKKPYDSPLLSGSPKKNKKPEKQKCA